MARAHGRAGDADGHADGNPEYGCELAPIDFARFADACGGTGFRIESPAECGALLDRVDPLEPPLPPKVTLEQVTHFAESLLRGEPNRTEIARTVLGGRIRELI